MHPSSQASGIIAEEQVERRLEPEAVDDDSVFWTQQGSCAHEVTEVVAAFTTHVQA